MSSDVIEQIDALLEHNRQLLTLAEQQAWDAFSEDIEGYLQRRAALCACDFNRSNAPHLAQLLAQDALLMQRIGPRLITLRTEIAALRKSRHSARAYQVIP